jgi:hypothetical protein
MLLGQGVIGSIAVVQVDSPVRVEADLVGMVGPSVAIAIMLSIADSKAPVKAPIPVGITKIETDPLPIVAWQVDVKSHGYPALLDFYLSTRTFSN